MKKILPISYLAFTIAGLNACATDDTADDGADAAVEATDDDAKGADDDSPADDDSATDDDDDDAPVDDVATDDDIPADDEDDDVADDDDDAPSDDDVADDELPSDDDLADDDSPADDDATDDDGNAPDGGTMTSPDAGADDDESTDDAGVDSDTADASTAEPTDSGTDPDPELVDGGAPEDPPNPNVVGAAGGTITNESGVELLIPAGALSSDVTITLAQVSPSNTTDVVSDAFDFGPDGLTFAIPATLTLPFDTSAAGEQEVKIAWLNSGTWENLDGCSTTGDLVTCEVSHFTTYAAVRQATNTTSCNLPPCAGDIDFAGCTPDAATTCETIIDGFTPVATNICYANGVKAQITGLTSEPITLAFKKTNGDACYSLDITGAQTSTYHYTWRNPSGAEVMTAVVESSNTDVVTYTCDGTQYVVDFSDEACAGESSPASTSTDGCAQGTCSY